jgi:hypothetical protein
MVLKVNRRRTKSRIVSHLHETSQFSPCTGQGLLSVVVSVWLPLFPQFRPCPLLRTPWPSFSPKLRFTLGGLDHSSVPILTLTQRLKGVKIILLQLHVQFRGPCFSPRTWLAVAWCMHNATSAVVCQVFQVCIRPKGRDHVRWDKVQGLLTAAFRQYWV